MKNILKSCLVIVMVIMLAGCGSVKDEEKTITCTLHKNDVINNYELNSTYEVKAKGEVVTNVTSTEVVSSNSADILSYFEETLNSTYKTMNDTYGGYDVNITNADGKVTSVAKIDYSKLNIEQLVKDDPSMKNAVNDKNELTVTGIKSMYSAMGITCEK